ncbi:hypothetical protein ACFOGJ_24400 [Marinibaculum pumilum]|uniref:Uncharacterized protein n=1 Tax=Marinibaculum pumilum TaxID=1766165 RepID=A0ABV7L704_9PROT|tara:strand:- start:196 stop:540 length:345 start_codon:yes stop_codon:yes gene_type:complete
MIIETRRLAFTDDSLIDAVTVALGSGVIKGPRVPVVRYEIPDVEGVMLRVMLKQPPPLGPQPMDLTMAQVAAILINYCRFRRIPVPRAGKKKLAAQGNAIILSITQELDTRKAA